MSEFSKLQDICRHSRGRIIDMSFRDKVPHLASSLSCVEILVSLYWSENLDLDPARWGQADRDRLFFSKGHAAATLYTVLAKRGFFPESELDQFAHLGSKLAEHPKPFAVPGLELATGSLGHGLSVGVGAAKAAKIRGSKSRVAVVMSDGECNEGSVWEAAMMAPRHGLDNLLAVVDYNKWQATGRSNEVMALSPFKDKWAAFGWHAFEIDGHDLSELDRVIGEFANNKTGKPVAVVANTVKGKGVSFMEDDNNWHYRTPTEAELDASWKELGLKS